ncbi:MAG: fatty-acid synthase [Anaerolineae bacterium]|nr:fatty-acid synthase [Anaerolineae bacterium]
MPASDRYHQTVIHALEKAGWRVTAEQVAVIVESRRLWIDLRAEKVGERLAILVEIKGFENTRSPVEYLASATGQYTLYRAVLDYLAVNDPLYMAVPEAAYRGILSEEIGKQVLHRSGVRLIVFDPEHEEIIQWID